MGVDIGVDENTDAGVDVEVGVEVEAEVGIEVELETELETEVGADAGVDVDAGAYVGTCCVGSCTIHIAGPSNCNSRYQLVSRYGRIPKSEMWAPSLVDSILNLVENQEISSDERRNLSMQSYLLLHCMRYLVDIDSMELARHPAIHVFSLLPAFPEVLLPVVSCLVKTEISEVVVRILVANTIAIAIAIAIATAIARLDKTVVGFEVRKRILDGL